MERRGGKEDPNGVGIPCHPDIAVTGADDQRLHALGRIDHDLCAKPQQYFMRRPCQNT
jgi:hypothetical protein